VLQRVGGVGVELGPWRRTCGHYWLMLAIPLAVGCGGDESGTENSDGEDSWEPQGDSIAMGPVVCLEGNEKRNDHWALRLARKSGITVYYYPHHRCPGEEVGSCLVPGGSTWLNKNSAMVYYYSEGTSASQRPQRRRGRTRCRNSASMWRRPPGVSWASSVPSTPMRVES
jgi:hypothetical protein